MIPQRLSIYHVPLDQREAYHHQHALAFSILTWMRAAMPRVQFPEEPTINLIPNGYWRDVSVAGFASCDTFKVSLPMAGTEGVSPGDALLATCGLSPEFWARVLVHEVLHVWEFAAYGSAALKDYPRDADRPSWSLATGLMSPILRIPDTGGDNWPDVTPFAGLLKILAPPGIEVRSRSGDLCLSMHGALDTSINWLNAETHEALRRDGIYLPDQTVSRGPVTFPVMEVA